MPEGDTIHHAAKRVRAALAGAAITSIETKTVPGARRGTTFVYERAGLPCRRCNGPIRSRGQGDDNRTTFWCPACQG